MNKEKRKKPRWLQKLYADLFGYFWIPCPICNQCFGGHETANEGLYVGNGTGKCVCRNCEDIAKNLSKENHLKEGLRKRKFSRTIKEMLKLQRVIRRKNIDLICP